MWKYRVKIRHLFTKNEDHASIQASMTAIADVLKKRPCFAGLGSLSRFYTIPQGNNPARSANDLLEQMWDYADACRIWIE